MKLYNTLIRAKEEFIPIEAGKVKMYSCGPTVYNYFHIGNARPFIMFDVLRRYFQYLGFEVTYVQNFTDIDDRMIAMSNKAGLSLKEFADAYIKEYYTDASGLGINRADIHPRATESMAEIINLIKVLIDKGHAYELEGDVYFETQSFKDYGKLSRSNFEELESGARVGVDDRKKSAMDFALWKAQKPGEPAWDSPWGQGRPGWHIECSAMACQHLGETIDIHSGGQDLVFPHHENEIAQSESASGKPFARYWLHNGFVSVKNEKMSKSLGNFFTVREVADKYGYEVIRFFMLSAHYRSPVNFSDELLDAAKNGLDRIYECRDNLKFLLSKMAGASLEVANSKPSAAIFDQCKKQFLEAMDDDLNTADAISVIFELVREINTKAIEWQKHPDISVVSCEVELAYSTLLELTGVLGLLKGREQAELAKEVEELISLRQTARKEKNWVESDRIRDRLKELGVALQDTPQGVKWTVVDSAAFEKLS